MLEVWEVGCGADHDNCQRQGLLLHKARTVDGRTEYTLEVQPRCWTSHVSLKHSIRCCQRARFGREEVWGSKETLEDAG